MVTCVMTPAELAFEQDTNINLTIIDTLINGIFFIDVFVNFTSAYYDEDYNLIDDHKVFPHISDSV